MYISKFWNFNFKFKNKLLFKLLNYRICLFNSFFFLFKFQFPKIHIVKHTYNTFKKIFIFHTY